MSSYDNIEARLNGKSGQTYITIALIGLAIVGFIDYLTGYKVSVSLFYVVPIFFAAWFGGRMQGILISACSFFIMLAANYIFADNNSLTLINVWNLLMYFGFFVTISLLFSKLRSDFDDRRKLISELQKALSDVKKLSGLLPTCASCKRIRDDKGSWTQMEYYIKQHSEADFTHGICPECARKLYPDVADKVLKKLDEGR